MTVSSRWLRCGWVVLLLACKSERTTESKDEAEHIVVGANAPPATASSPRAGGAPAISGAPAASASRVDAGAGYDPCEELCARSRELACQNASRCPDSCREMLTGATCADPLRLALRCFAAQPLSRWECGEDGMANVKDGTCDTEQARYAQCIASVVGQ
jgi:hypothetical protein